MKRPAFQRLKDFKADLERRATLLRGREREILTELAKLNEEFPEAAIQGEAKIVQETIDKLAAELEAVRRELAVLQNPPVGGYLGTLVEDAWQEATNIITGDLRKEWATLAAELDKRKETFLAVVRELGKVKQRADGVTASMMEELVSIPAPKLAVPSLATGVFERSKTGIIYITPQESEKSFKGA